MSQPESPYNPRSDTTLNFLFFASHGHFLETGGVFLEFDTVSESMLHAAVKGNGATRRCSVIPL